MSDRLWAGVPMRAMLDDRLDAASRLVLLGLGCHTDSNGLCWPSVKTLQERTKLSRATVFRALSDLEGFGWIRRTKRQPRSGVTIYQVVLDLSPDAIERVVSQGDPRLTQRRPPSHTETPPVSQGDGEVVQGTKAEKLPDDDVRVSVPLTHPAAIEAYRALRARVMSPSAFDAMLRTVAEPMTGGTAYSWDEVGQALVELAPQGGATAAAIRAFCRRVRAGDPVRASGAAPTDALAELRKIRAEADAAVAREQAQGVANG